MSERRSQAPSATKTKGDDMKSQLQAVNAWRLHPSQWAIFRAAFRGVDFYQTYKDLDSDLISATENPERLLDVLDSLQETINNRKFRTDERGLLKNIEKSIIACEDSIEELQDECEKLKKIPSGGFRASVRVAGRRAAYPFRKSTLQKLDEDIDMIRSHLSSAMGVLQLKDNKRFQDDVLDIKVLLSQIKSNQISSDLRDWLKAPDATIDHNNACLKKHPGTGNWLVTDPRLTSWKTRRNSILWVNGFAGSGKSVLCSTAIQTVHRHLAQDSRAGIAFFYFTFNDESKQDDSSMLRALLLQLSAQLQDDYADLKRLYNSYKSGIPPSRVLIEYLKCLINRFDEVFIVLDALDESPRHGPRGQVLDVLEIMRQWDLQGLHLLLTSRNEPDIQESLNLSANEQIKMQNSGIDKDIADFVSGRLEKSRSLRRWAKYRDKIQETLCRRSQGVFRWVECQLKTLESCPCSSSHLDRMLHSLPRSLDETYERMLCNIDESLIQDARRILALLCFASRPLTLPELIDGIAVEINEAGGLNKDSRLDNYDDILRICPGFIDTSYKTDYDDYAPSSETDNSGLVTIRIAHFSIQEYLQSDRIREHKAKTFSLNHVQAHAELAKICLIYLLDSGLSSLNSLEVGNIRFSNHKSKRYPLAHFAAESWYHHFVSASELTSEVEPLILRLLQQQKSFINWLRLCYHNYLIREDFYRTLTSSRPGSDNSESHTMATPSDPGEKQPQSYDRALFVASYLGYEMVVRLLLDGRVDANVRICDNTALGVAVKRGREKTVAVLLDGGADVNEKSENLSPLSYASKWNLESIVRLLLDKGADVNPSPDGDWASPLSAASHYGNESIVKLLLENGADPNMDGDIYGTPLSVAAYYGYESIVELLLESGADPNGFNGQAIRGASSQGFHNVVQRLLDGGADINAGSLSENHALIRASENGHTQMVAFLIEQGADISAQGERGIKLGARGGYEKVVQVLLDNGARIPTGWELYAAARAGCEEDVQLLLDRGASVPEEPALQAASYHGHETVVRLLFDRGADGCAQAGERAIELALWVATKQGHADIERLLLDRGARHQSIEDLPEFDPEATEETDVG